MLRLGRHFTISIVDCGSTLDFPVTQEVLRDLDALIVVLNHSDGHADKRTRNILAQPPRPAAASK